MTPTPLNSLPFLDPAATGADEPPAHPEGLRVSVIIPTYNNGPWLARTVDSVLAQTRPAHEIIVVDDVSTDDTPATLAALAPRCAGRLISIRQDSNRGPAAARNAGIARATGELVAFLDGDDAWLPAMIERQTAEFAAHPELGLCYSSLTDCDAELTPTRPPRAYRRRRSERVFDELYLTAFVMPTSTVFVRRRIFAEVGAFSETLYKAEDYECWLRIAMRHPVSCLDEPLALRRHHGRALTSAVKAAANINQEREVFERCGRAAAALGLTLPMPVPQRQALSLRRRLVDYLDDADVAGARLCLDELRRIDRVSPADTLRFELGRLRVALRRRLGRI